MRHVLVNRLVCALAGLLLVACLVFALVQA
jgi:hypothetical protein